MLHCALGNITEFEVVLVKLSTGKMNRGDSPFIRAHMKVSAIHKMPQDHDQKHKEFEKELLRDMNHDNSEPGQLYNFFLRKLMHVMS